MSDDLPTLDPAGLDQLLEMTGGDPAFVEELIETFLVDAATQLEELSAAAAAASVEDILRPAHSLKSNSASVGARRLSEAARSLESDARTGRVPDASTRVSEAAAELERVRAALDARPRS